MASLAQWLGLKPRNGGRIDEATACAAALAHLRAGGTEGLPAASRGSLTWDAHGRAVWRFIWPGPVPDGPELVCDVDAASGGIVRAGVPPR